MQIAGCLRPSHQYECIMRDILVSTIVLFFIIHFTASSQRRDDTIEASWDRAPKSDIPVKPKVAETRKAPVTDAYNPPWNRERPLESRPWPVLPANPTADQVYQANKSLIDSLSNLYCLSNNYIRTLTNRNEAAYATHPASPKRDFHYSDPSATKSPHTRESLEAVYKELNGLLEQCLYGRQ